MNHWKF